MSQSASAPSRPEQTEKISRSTSEQRDKEELTSPRHSGDQLSTHSDRALKWQEIIWREWRNSEDKEYAYQLYKSVVRHSKPWPVATLRIILGWVTSIGCVGGQKLSGYDPSETAPFSIGVTLGLIAALIVGTVFGVGPGLVFGLMIGSTAFYALMLALAALPRWRERIAVAFDRWCKQEEPPMAQVEMALREAAAVWPQVRSTWAEPLHLLQKQKQQPDSLDSLMTDLQSNDWLTRFVARYGLVSLGGAAVESLQALAESRNIPLNRLAVRLLKSIEMETTARWAEKAATLLCPHCLVRCQAHLISLSWQPDLTFYGCRACNQSQEFLEGINHVVAVLDAVWLEAQLRQQETLRVNWLIRRTLFDFDRVEIVQATDEDVERFAVQVGNDTDSGRKPRYSRIACTIEPECHLSENTLRVLRRIFGEVSIHAPHL
jgi:hypothetical protein